MGYEVCCGLFPNIYPPFDHRLLFKKNKKKLDQKITLKFLKYFSEMSNVQSLSFFYQKRHYSGVHSGGRSTT